MDSTVYAELELLSGQLPTSQPAMEVAGRPSADQQVSISNCDPCMYTGESVNSVSFCVDCIEYLCMNCLKYHKKTKTTRDHRTLEGNSVPSNKYSFERMQSTTLCPTHVDQKVTYKCTDHSVYVCLKCVWSDHLACKSLVDITKLIEVENTIELIHGYISKVKQKQDYLHKTMENAISQLNIEKEMVLEKRKQLMHKLRAFLVQLERSSEEIEEKVRTECDRISAKARPTLEKADAYNTQVNFLQTALDFGCPIQVYMVAQEFRIFKTDILQLDEKDNYICHIDDNLDDEVYDLFKKLPEPTLSVRAREDSQDLATNLLQDIQVTETETHVDNDKSNVQEEIITTIGPAQNVAESLIKTRHNVSLSVGQRILPTMLKKHIDGTTKDTHLIQMLTTVTLDNLASQSEELKIASNSQGYIFVLMCHSKTLITFDKKLRLWKQLSLETTPTSACCVGNGEFVVVFNNKSLIRYLVDQEGLSSYNSFAFKLFCGSISRYGEQQVVCLCFNPLVPSWTPTYVVIEIRDYWGGKVHNKFHYNNSHQKPASLLSVYSRYFGEIILFSNTFFEFLSEIGERIRFIEWSGISRSITGDRAGNLYFFDTSRESIFYISKHTFKVLKIVEMKGMSTAALTYVPKELNLIMLCYEASS